jgi:diacylglycerol kinase (ATP)
LHPPCIIFNPTAKGDKARLLRRQVEQLGDTYALRPTTGPGAARPIAAAAVAEGYTTLIAAGGDGTVNEVLNGIGDHPHGFEQATLGIIPLGTANVLARELAIPLDLTRAREVLGQGRTLDIDLICVTHRRDGEPARRWMVQLAGAGLDARAVELVDWSLKKRLGYLAYVIAGLRALLGASPKITVNSRPWQAAGELVLLGNGRLYGGSFNLFPSADIRDGLLEVRVFPRANWRTALAFAMAALTGRFAGLGNSVDFRGTCVELNAELRVPLEIDGEAVGELPAHFEVHPRKLRVIVP